jgi:UrcA family protein
MRRFTIALAAVAIIAAPAAAFADGFRARVQTKDHDLQTDAGVQVALERIHKAAVRACSDVAVGTRIPSADLDCVQQVSAQFVKQMNAPMVQAAFEAKKTRGQG